MSELKKAKDEVSNRIKALGDGTRDLKKYTQQIWLAGLGAFARAEEEGGKFFDNLVELGQQVEEKTKNEAQSRMEEVKSKVKNKTTDTMEKMEKAFDERLNNALSRLGIPTRNEVESLSTKLNDLTDAIKDIGKPGDRAAKGKGKDSKK